MMSQDSNFRSGEVTSSWLSPSPRPSPDSIPNQEQQCSSFHSEHIWQNHAHVNHNNSVSTPITSPSPVPLHGWVIQSPTSSPGVCLEHSENDAPFMNGYESLPSPQMSSSIESMDNSGFFPPRYCSPTVHDDWTYVSDSQNVRGGELFEHGGSFDYPRMSPAQPAIGLVYLSGSWPQNEQVDSDYEKVETHKLRNGYCSSWTGSEIAQYQTKPIPFRRSISCKSDDDSWIGHGKEILTGSSYSKQNPSNELHMRVDQCYEQLRYLEKERLKVGYTVAV